VAAYDDIGAGYGGCRANLSFSFEIGPSSVRVWIVFGT
jgi:hypothetical protein